VTRHPVLRLLRSSILLQVALLVSGPLVVRLVGVDGRGEIALVWAVVLLVAQVAVLGIHDAVSWYVARQALDGAAMVRAQLPLFAGLVGAGAVVAAGGVLLLHAEGHDLERPYAEAGLAAAGVVVIMVSMLLMAGLKGEERYTALARLQLLPGLFYAVSVGVLFALTVRSVPLVLLAAASAWLAVAVVAARLLVVRRNVRTAAMPAAADVRRFGRRSMLVNAAPIDNLGIDQLLIGLVLGQTALGFYVIGFAFETAPVLLLVSLGSYVGTRVAALPAAERAAFARRWLMRGLVIGALTCLAIQLVLQPVLVFAFGEPAAGAEATARIFVLAGVFLGLRRLGGAILLGLGLPTESTRAELVGFTVMVVGVLLGGWLGGVEGATWALVAAGLATVLAQWPVLQRAASASPVSA